jgi:type IV pilus assembly protein PilQ
MRKYRILIFVFLFWIFTFACFIKDTVFVFCFAKPAPEELNREEGQSDTVAISTEQPPPNTTETTTEKTNQQIAIVEDLEKSKNVTLDFKDADIRNVLKIISLKSGVNIVATPEVMGNVTIRLVDVPWEIALNVILKTYGYGYERTENIITVTPIEKLTAQKKQEVELAQVQPTITEVFNLKYIDAQDAKKALDSQLSPRGKITILEMTGQAGWEFGTAATETGKRKRVAEEKLSRSKVLIVSDIPPVLEEIKKVIDKIDMPPLQVVIETRIMEVSRDKLRDIGFDWGTGTGGAVTSTVTTDTIAKDSAGLPTQKIGGNILASQVKPAVFTPKASDIAGLYPYNTGLSLLFQKLNGQQFEVLLHALEEDIHANLLSAPRILAINNQEATILIGTRYPIMKQETATSGSTSVTTVTLDQWMDIGIQLNVVPQIGANNYINMVVHPAVSSYTNTLGTTVQYPILEIREAETRVFMKDGETVVIGGLLKDYKSKGTTGIPFLKNIPFLGPLFRRDTVDTAKVDLIIFITAHIVKEGEFTSEEIKNLEQRLTTLDKKLIRKK